MNIKKLLLAFVLILVFFFLNSSSIFASNNFTTDYHVIYTVNDSGNTHADLSITLTNTSAQFYASSYQMQLGFNNISNIKASDPLGPIETTVNKTSEGYNISLKFNKKSLGLGTKLPFNLSFDTTSVTHHSGKIWEINISKISDPADFNSFVVEVKPPASFGKPAFIKPLQANNSLTFSKNRLEKSGISIAFGEKQIYNFKLTYHLKNDNLFPIRATIALPPDTNYQQVFIKDINPNPENVIVDENGNWLAEYPLSAVQAKEVIVTGNAEVNLSPKSSPISNSEKAIYTNQTPNWQSKNRQIKQLADQLKTPQAIYQYVVKTLKYDFNRVIDEKERQGSVNALNNPNSAVCLEFTDLFIALARASGIPAREIDGFAYTENSKDHPLSLVSDVLHAWPEYYDTKNKTWIMVDPTWENTTGGVDYFNVLDFNHLAFAIKGDNDSYPIPAGRYKSETNKNIKDVKVSFADMSLDKNKHLDITSSFPSTQIAGFPIKGTIKLKNDGPGSISSELLYVTSKNLTPKEQIFEVLKIPPFGYVNEDVTFDKTSLLTNKQSLITMHSEDKTSTQTIMIVPFFLNFWGIGGITIGLFTIILLIIAGKSRRLRLHR